MLIAFLVLVLCSYLLDLPKFLGLPFLARVVIFLCFFIGLIAVRARVESFGQSPYGESIRDKVLAIRVCLVALFLFSSLMGMCFSSWPAQIFNFEYLLILPILLVLAPKYVGWVEGRMPLPDDGYARLGQALLGKRRWCWNEQRALILAWMVKLFFIPLMYTWLVMAVEDLLTLSWRFSPTTIVFNLFAFGLAMDLLIACAGYIFVSRLLGNDVLSTDSTWLGWLCCLICYPPLLDILRAIKRQSDDVIWSQWLAPHEPLYWLWAALITLTWLVYWMSTMSFGLRFSNLSWRGLVDSGPYRYTKHPAYISKNLYWWLHTVPFVGVSSSLDLWRNILGLSFVSLVYYLRAKTEERHLMAFPEYAAYAARIEQDGLLARCVRCLRVRQA